MEKQRNYSRKRDAILRVMRETRAHPSAEWVYSRLKAEYPDLSLGTVYRNLGLFREEGVVMSVGVVAGQERFDADVRPHAHFVCERCRRVLDVEEPEAEDFARRVQNLAGGVVLGHQLTLTGICGDCLRESGDNQVSSN